MRLKTIAAAAGLAVVLSLGMGATPGSADGVLDSFANRAKPATPGGSASGSSANLDNPAAPITLGWHYGHAAFCGWFLDSGGNQWFYIFLTDTDAAFSYPTINGLIFGINNLFIGQGMAPPCAMGHWIAWHVVNSSSGAFDQTYSYPYYDPQYGNF